MGMSRKEHALRGDQLDLQPSRQGYRAAIASGEPVAQAFSGPREILTKRLIHYTVAALVIFCFLIVVEDVSTQEATFQIVAHPSLAIETIAKKDLARIFLKRKKAWPNGATATPVDQKTSVAVRSEFSLAVLGKDKKAVDSFWNG